MYKNKFVWLMAFALVFFALGVILEYLYKSPQNKDFKVEAFQAELNKQKIFLDQATVSMASAYLSDSSVIWRSKVTQSIHQHDFLVYKDTLLVGWSSQALPLNNSLPSSFTKPVVRLSNGWYITSSKKKNGFTFIGLKSIKTEYQYQNSYIVNAFAPCFKLDANVTIVDAKLPGGTNLYGTNGDYLLTVVAPSVGTNNYKLALYSLISFAIAIIIVAILVFWLLKLQSAKGNANRILWMLSALSILFYFLFFATGWLTSLSTLSIFSPVYFAYSYWLSSIGAFIAAALLLAWLTFLFYLFYQPVEPIKYSKIRYVFGYLAVVLFFWLITFLVFVLVEHSTDVYLFSRIVDLTSIEVYKLVVVFLLFFSFGLWFDKLLRFYIVALGWRYMLLVSAIVLSIVFGISTLIDGLFDWRSFCFLLAVSVFGILNRRKNGFIWGYRHLLWIVLLFDLYAVALFFKFNMTKEKANRTFLIETLANKLAGEQDAVAEMYLADAERKIAVDPNIIDIISNGAFYEEDLRQYLVKNYFIGYLNRYEIQVVPCWPRAELFVEGANQTFDCYRYFADMVKNYGEKVYGSSHFHFLKKDNGRINYFGVFKYFENIAGKETSLFIEFTSKPFFEGLGYPELLISDKDKAQFDLLKGYSYAKYVNGHLAKRSGPYLYQVTNQRFNRLKEEGKYFVFANKYSHLVYVPRVGTNVVMSCLAVGLSNVLMAFSVIYILFLSLSTLAILLTRLGQPTAPVNYSIRERIQISMIAFSLVLLVVVGTSSVLYAVYQHKAKNYDMLSQRLKSVLMEMEQKIGTESKLTPDMVEYLNYLLQTFSNVFYTDINLFGLDGRLLATSRPELYQKGVVGNYMNPDAYQSLSLNGEREFIHNESIGSLNYISAYVPFLNQRNDVLAYLNLPYFVGQNELREEISSIFVAMVNAYLVFILIAIGLAILASRQITRPLLLLQQRISQTRLGLKNEKIQYARPDEIGHLVDEYNRMVDELARSADKLAKSERELAWREMAKQIAHEIKNPLTPMQLSIQYLQKAWDDKVPDFDKYIRRVTQTLIEQIRQLSVIATEFSHFAKMPAARIERINIIEKLTNTITLYEKSSDANFTLSVNGPSHVWVNIDGEQLLSVYNNLIKNALQAARQNQIIEVSVEVKVIENHVRMAFADNGRGVSDEIKDKLFTPNFTTKTSGMGLGLAIVKNIIEGVGGKIWFETSPGQGSVFYVLLPLSDEI